MKAILKKVGEKKGQLIEIENDLAALQEAVGGYLDMKQFTTSAAILFDDDGRIKDRPYNCSIMNYDIVGDLLIVGIRGDHFGDVPDFVNDGIGAVRWFGFEVVVPE